MIKPIGLTIPDCECFKNNLKQMNKYIDEISVILMLEALRDANAIHLCDKAREYYVAAIVWTMVAALIKKKETHDENKLVGADYRLDFEQTWDRLKPLVMERIDYVDAQVMRGRK